jgi:hypothetical protein
MPPPLLIANPENATIEELKQLLDPPDVDIWFADESGFEGDPRPRKRWDKKRIN